MMTTGNRIPGQRPAELFRADLISAMKIPDSQSLEAGTYLTIREPWRPEWDIGVQVCVNPEQSSQKKWRSIDPPPYAQDFRMPSTHTTEENTPCLRYVEYDLDDLDLNWLEMINKKRKFKNILSEETLRCAVCLLETKCQQNMASALTSENALSIEYDESTVCDVCKDKESEDTNEMIFCDVCNVCVHQACYGIATIPEGEWICKPCVSGESNAKCVLCPNTGGALKRVRPGNTNWAHLSCALWIPEVRVGNVDKMEPITNVEAVPMSRKNLVCYLCRKKEGVCIQCSQTSCVAAYHVTCAFKNGLEMKSKLDVANSGVVHESYCLKHTRERKSSSRQSSPCKNDVSAQLVQVSQEFYKYTSPDDLVAGLKLSLKVSTLIYNYWKLKRRSLHNRTMLTDLPIESSLESIRAEVDWARKNGASDDEKFYTIVHLRQNFEKARNLVYMVQRRERLKKQLLQKEEELFQLESSLLLQEDGRPKVDPVSSRQTRSKASDQHGGVDSIAPTNCVLVNHTPEIPCVTRALRTRGYHNYDVASPTADKNHQQIGTKRKFSERELNSPPVTNDSEIIDEPAHNLRHRFPQVIS